LVAAQLSCSAPLRVWNTLTASPPTSAWLA
jgi:hypothetical protein